MDTFMITRSACERKTYEAIPQNIPAPHNDLCCPRPQCRANCHFSSVAERIWCPVCGWALILSQEQTMEITTALAGISDLPIAQYLLILDAESQSSTNEGLARVAEDRTAPGYRAEGGVL